MCISEAACKPQERASKAKGLIGTRAHAVQHIHAHIQPHTHTVMHMQYCVKTVSHIAIQTHACRNLHCDSSRGLAYMNMQPGTETGRTKRDKGLIHRERLREETQLNFHTSCPMLTHKEGGKMGQRWTKNACERDLEYIHAADKNGFN